MRCTHDFGSFYPTLTVDGHTVTFDQYKGLDWSARNMFREEIQNRCVEANRRRSAMWDSLSRPICDKYRKEIAALPKSRDRKFKVLDLQQAQRQELSRAQEGLPEIEGNTYPAAVWDIMTVWESRVETDKEKLARFLADFDWYYSYSDDFQVWSASQRRLSEIRALVTKLGQEGQAMWDAAQPK